MTFSLLGRCRSTGQLGAVVTTSDLAVGARVPFALPGVGVAVTQNRTDPRLGPALLGALAAGAPAQQAIAELVTATPQIAWRQLGVLDAAGNTAAYTGSHSWPVAGALAGDDCLAIGNMLANDEVLVGITEAFLSSDGALAPRLVAGIAAGQRAGGETGMLRSAALVVVERESFPLVDLRIDAAADPLDALEALWREYEPRARDFVTRALDPDRAHGSSTNTSPPS
jgi:uncharacterized Ntn-hydrolase superfamily protein